MTVEKQRHYYRLGIVGNCAYIAYIDDKASVRWLCMPRFNSSFLFGSLLDPQQGGNFPQTCSHVGLMNAVSASRESWTGRSSCDLEAQPWE
jgi:hypothetical protein